jgi:hypothetical protein
LAAGTWWNGTVFRPSFRPGLSAGTMTLVMKGGPVSPRTLRLIALALTKHATISGLGELLDDSAA